MNKKIIKALVITTAVSMIISTTAAFADSGKSAKNSKTEQNINHNKNSYSNKHNNGIDDEKDDEEILGTVIRVYGNKIEVETEGAEIITVKITNKTEIEIENEDDEDNEESTFKCLKVGMIVDIELKNDKSNQHQLDAEKVTILGIESDDEDEDDEDDEDTTENVIINNASVEKIYNNNVLINNDGTLLILNITNETKFFNQFNQEITFAGIKKGMIVKVEHSPQMTKSIPAITNAVEITVIKDQKDNVKIKSEVVEVDKYDKTITIGNKEKLYEQLVLNINEDTKLLDRFNMPISIYNIKPGMIILVEHSSAMTRSIPAQTNAVSIKIVKSIPDSILLSTKVLDVLEDRILVGEKEHENTYKYLLINYKTIITDKNGKIIELSDIKEGMSITVEHSMISTLSIPPQTQAYIIIVNN
ncbi:hypothetical protein JYG23_13865 [Sedimentibacter sp. zth1]|uniref:DUF5666 domain-containing protein n=1 Tax=Sedimentibacter sp. zth1 TaxID=2816908 RepID=UPI001A92F9F4|nr:DUF5666 domain-containing protein [Sedimentibacter sp. zth1]QSX05733.1 hypothetical protein JYG23_13865 [Sedimentibacter sp. zth1]